MNDGSKYVGLDVHKETIAISIAEASGGEVRYYGEIKNTPEAIRKLCEKIKPERVDYFSVTNLATVASGSIGS